MRSITARLKQLEGKVSDQQFNRRRLAAERWMHGNVAVVNAIRAKHFPQGDRGQPLCHNVHIDDMKQLVAIERAMKERQQAMPLPPEFDNHAVELGF